VLEAVEMPVIRGAAFQFYQLFDNIVGNSIKYSRDGVKPHIRISHEVVHGKDITYDKVDENKSYHRISITDNGIGFEQKNAAKIFEIFQRLHGRDEYSGTGIGLAICKKIVQGYNGFIYANGEVNKGANFFICIPTS
jgi:signal transduction histidine kinase